MKLGVIDLDTGNLTSLLSALNRLNIKFTKDSIEKQNSPLI